MSDTYLNKPSYKEQAYHIGKKMRYVGMKKCSGNKSVPLILRKNAVGIKSAFVCEQIAIHYLADKE